MYKESTGIGQVKKKLTPLGLEVSYDQESEEFRINFKRGKEDTAYYTNDAEDAIMTGKAMMKESLKELYTIQFDDKDKRALTGKSLGYIRGPGLYSLKRIPGTEDYEIYNLNNDKVGIAMKESELIIVPRDTLISGTDYILEKGDRIKVLKEDYRASIIIDVALSGSQYRNFIILAQRKYKLGVEEISDRGPGSQWPEVKFYGSYQNVKSFFLNEYDDDEDLFDEIVRK